MNFPLPLKELRLALGLGQEEMANLLAVNRGQLSMAESGRRALPAIAILRLNGINKILESPDPSTEPAPGLSDENKSGWLTSMLTKLKSEEQQLLKRQKQGLQNGQSGNLLGKLLSRLDELSAPGYDPEGDRLWKENTTSYREVPDEEESWSRNFSLALELDAIAFKIRRLEEEMAKVAH